jgi:hypothetical protein
MVEKIYLAVYDIFVCPDILSTNDFISCQLFAALASAATKS